MEHKSGKNFVGMKFGHRCALFTFEECNESGDYLFFVLYSFYRRFKFNVMSEMVTLFDY
jgi:hypothetical protein